MRVLGAPSEQRATQAQWRQHAVTVLCSISSSLVANIFATPFDVLKVRQQRASVKGRAVCFNHRSLISTARFIVRNEGVSTLYNGLRYSLQMAVLANVFRFTLYESVKTAVLARTNAQIGVASAVSSLAANVVVTTIVFPLEYWKVKQQAHRGVCRLKGFALGRHLYAAYIVTVQRNLGFWLTFLPVSEKVREGLMLRAGAGAHDSPQAMHHAHLKQRGDALIDAFSGLVGGAIAATVSMPLDVIKTRKQVFERDLLHVPTLTLMKDVWHTQGARALYAGFVPRLLNCSIYGTIQFSIYNGLHYFL